MKQLPKKVKIASALSFVRSSRLPEEERSNNNLERHFVVRRGTNYEHSHQFRKWELARVSPIAGTGLLLRRRRRQ